MKDDRDRTTFNTGPSPDRELFGLNSGSVIANEASRISTKLQAGQNKTVTRCGMQFTDRVNFMAENRPP